jgi:integrase
MGLGGYPEVSLSKAREKARVAKELIEQGIDPIEQKRANKAALTKNRMTFKEAAYKTHEKKKTEFKNSKHAKQWISTLEKYAFPFIGSKQVSVIELPDVLQVLEPIWQKKTETATRVRQRIETVLIWAEVSGYRSGDNPARWRGHLSEVLPKPSKIKAVQNMPALPYKDMYSFMTELRKRPGLGARALELIVLTACRSGECRFATWDEFNFSEKVWVIPAEHMKGGREHRIPLTSDVIELLKNLPRFEGSNYIFPASKGGPLSDMTISGVCRRMQVSAVPHGFRSTFRTWASETTNFPHEVCEQALAHVVDNKTEAAYKRGTLFNKRRQLLEAWQAFINTKPAEEGAKVIKISRGAAK